jgi:hypothetical protein
MHFAFVDRQIDPVVGDKITKFFYHIDHLDYLLGKIDGSHMQVSFTGVGSVRFFKLRSTGRRSVKTLTGMIGNLGWGKGS